MKLNYTKATKAHIAQMAVRKKYMATFDKKLSILSTDFTVLAERLGDHNALSKLPVELHRNFKSVTGTPNWFRTIFKIKNYIALQSRQNIKTIKFDKTIFVTDNTAQSLVESKEGSKLIIDFQKFLKEIDQFSTNVTIALDTYSTYNKALNALPWIDGLHPDKDKVTTCNLVPIDTINKVNELMGKL